MPASSIELAYLVAIAFVWSRGTIFRWLRERIDRALGVDFAGCPLCSGFWIGVLGHALYLAAPVVVVWLGIGSIVGLLALALCAIVRRI